MTVGELIAWLEDKPGDLRVMAYDYERHDRWVDIDVRVCQVKPVPNQSYANYGSGETIVSIQ